MAALVDALGDKQRSLLIDAGAIVAEVDCMLEVLFVLVSMCWRAQLCIVAD